MPYPMTNNIETKTLSINLFNALRSLLTITEGEDLDSDSQKIIHFNIFDHKLLILHLRLHQQ